ncbi:MAG TPA: hydroxyacid dehydrogenase [Armatimonadota bacterium]|jgi:phosphoglycerate dehydrogenase-like enzyme
MPTIALLTSQQISNMVIAQRHLTQLATLGTVIDARFNENAAEVLERLAEADILFSSWGMPVVDEAFLQAMPRLRAIFYAAGSVKGFVTPAMWARGITLSSSAVANAVPVAEYTIGVILLSNKRFWSMMGTTQRLPVPGNYRRTVGIISASMVGRDVIRLLQPYAMDVLLYDPFVDAEQAARLGVRKVELTELMAASDIVSLHAPNLPSLRHMINAELLAQMKDGATFINTARGALVDEAALIDELSSGRLHAVLDVTDPEPPAADSPFYTLPNVIYTPHIAGSMDQECHRMADFALAELERYLAGEPLHNAIQPDALARMA